MTVADYIVDSLIKRGVTDVFGLPGGVILDFLYAIDKKRTIISAHLNYHEQNAAFAACGYAQVTNKLGVAYATRGPGITNMITGIADAYYDSIPVLFITAHAHTCKTGMRIETDQELNLVPMLSNITKYSVRIDRLEDVFSEFEKCCDFAVSGRKGPVVVDFSSELFSQNINPFIREKNTDKEFVNPDMEEIIAEVVCELKKSKRPILFIGDGLRQSDTISEIKKISEAANIPVLSSRYAQDCMPHSLMYFGYIGTHATRYSNFIFSKADLIIALGNRMSFPIDSPSFGPLFNSKKTIRIEIDTSEFLRNIPNSINYNLDLKIFSSKLRKVKLVYSESEKWVNICNKIKEKLWNYDTEYPVNIIAKILNSLSPNIVITSDVGNNEFWLSRAYAYAQVQNRVLYSKSFGTLGCSLAKAIGVYFSTHSTVVCFTGDQGFQLNLQELQFISSHQLPVAIILLNNFSSGMIRSRQKKRQYSHYLHTTLSSGYSVPEIERIAQAYQLNYLSYSKGDIDKFVENFRKIIFPCIVEIKINESIDLELYLPKGNSFQNLSPSIPTELYDELELL